MPGARFSDVRHFERIDSTNRYLLDEARAGAPEGVVAVADFQTAGRGRQGRRWAAPPASNLLVSVLLRPRLPPALRPLALAAVALAARDAARDVAGVTLGIKWPNDLVDPDGRKVAGVLAEADADGAADTSSDGDEGHETGPAVVVGIGINCNWPAGDDPINDAGEQSDSAGPGTGLLDDAALARATSLRRLGGQPVDRAALLAALLERLGPRVDELEEPSGRSRLRADLRSATTTIGALVRVELADGTIEGRATGLTDEGHLVVATERGTETVVTGDVVHLREARDVSPSDRTVRTQD
jgi:BirA family transcriptional regulator, biotin operon repressor / biotin---[acetyl-CoA-carboxylase] ligase